ncbi:MAG: sulfotransferase family protein [Caulobacter sp.]|nr:sulfotransferase family protein [Caulobacter sp.]
MNAIIRGKPDNLDAVGLRFERARLSTPVFLNSVPKAGTHLLRNIFRMFVDPEQHWRREYVQHAILRQSRDAFAADKPFVSWGHLLFSDEAAIALRDVRHIVLVRDPYDWVLARSRFYLSDEFQGALNSLKDGGVAVEDLMNMMIFGIHGKAPPLLDIFTFNAVAWMGGKAVVVRYEDIVANVKDLGSQRAEAFFGQLLAAAGLALPEDWRERVAAGADPRESRTARENLSLTVAVPAELPPVQKALVDFHAPGLRALLGYA